MGKGCRADGTCPSNLKDGNRREMGVLLRWNWCSAKRNCSGYWEEERASRWSVVCLTQLYSNPTSPSLFIFFFGKFGPAVYFPPIVKKHSWNRIVAFFILSLALGQKSKYFRKMNFRVCGTYIPKSNLYLYGWKSEIAFWLVLRLF